MPDYVYFHPPLPAGDLIPVKVSRLELHLLVLALEKEAARASDEILQRSAVLREAAR